MAATEPPGGAPGQGPSHPLPSTVAVRVEEIVEAAQRQAELIKRDLEARRLAAEAEVQSYLEEARRQADAVMERSVQRMRDLTDDLVDRAQATRQHFDGLIAALERATVRLEHEAAQAQPPGAEGREPRPAAASRRAPAAAPARSQPPRPVPAGRPGRAWLAERGSGPQEPSPASLEAARLVAIEMAVAGRTRAEVDAHLRESFRISQAAGLLDDVFGSDGGDATGTPWAGP